MQSALASPDDVRTALDAVDYLPDDGTVTAVFLALHMGRPLLLEGEPGVGKTALADALAAVTGTEVIRLSCYEGIDASQALYTWDFARQLLHLRTDRSATSIYTQEFLIARPLLRALQQSPCVLLIDEVDRADDAFEAFLLELLADGAVTIPELGTVKPATPPTVILTSNRTRELHDALKRRCLYHWIEHPDVDREIAIIRRRVPDAGAKLARDVAELVEKVRATDLQRAPGVAESIDWTVALALLGGQVTPQAVGQTLGVAVKDHDDQQRVRAQLPTLLPGIGG